MGEACNKHEIPEISTQYWSENLKGWNSLKDLHVWEDIIKMGIKQNGSELDLSVSGCGQVRSCFEFSIEHLVFHIRRGVCWVGGWLLASPGGLSVRSVLVVACHLCLVKKSAANTSSCLAVYRGCPQFLETSRLSPLKYTTYIPFPFLPNLLFADHVTPWATDTVVRWVINKQSTPTLSTKAFSSCVSQDNHQPVLPLARDQGTDAFKPGNDVVLRRMWNVKLMVSLF